MIDYLYNFGNISKILDGWMVTFLPSWGVYLVMAVISCTAVLLYLVPAFMVAVYVERKAIAHFQVRSGPMRVGWHGSLQIFADAIKMMTKEDTVPAAADKFLFTLAPIVSMIPAILAFAVIPFNKDMIFADLDIGVLYIISVTTISVLAAFMAGWSSKNKYSLLGAMRAVAQMVSYEVPMVLSILGVVMITGSLSMTQIVEAQTVPFIILQPLGFIVCFIASLAELNRCPMDLMEAESEIIAGYHTEYSGMKFGLFYLGEYMAALASAGLITTLFLGGWRGPAFIGPLVPSYVWFIGKVFFLFWVLVWIRGTLPRLRVDQLMGFAWKVLLPLALVNILLTGLGITVLQGLFK